MDKPDYTLHGIHSLSKDRSRFAVIDRGKITVTCVLTVYRQPLSSPAIDWLFDRGKERPLRVSDPHSTTFVLEDLHYNDKTPDNSRITTAVFGGSCTNFVRRRNWYGRKRSQSELGVWPQAVLETLVGALTRRWKKLGLTDITHPVPGFTLELLP